EGGRGAGARRGGAEKGVIPNPSHQLIMLSSPRKRGPITTASGIWVPACAGTTAPRFRCARETLSVLKRGLRASLHLQIELAHQPTVPPRRGRCPCRPPPAARSGGRRLRRRRAACPRRSPPARAAQRGGPGCPPAASPPAPAARNAAPTRIRAAPTRRRSAPRA